MSVAVNCEIFVDAVGVACPSYGRVGGIVCIVGPTSSLPSVCVEILGRIQGQCDDAAAVALA